MFDSQAYHQDRPQGLKNKKINIQEFRPGCSAMQWHCALRLFFKKCTYGMVLTQLYNTWSVALRPLVSFLLDKRAPNGPV